MIDTVEHAFQPMWHFLFGSLDLNYIFVAFLNLEHCIFWYILIFKCGFSVTAFMRLFRLPLDQYLQAFHPWESVTFLIFKALVYRPINEGIIPCIMFQLLAVMTFALWVAAGHRLEGMQLWGARIYLLVNLVSLVQICPWVNNFDYSYLSADYFRNALVDWNLLDLLLKLLLPTPTFVENGIRPFVCDVSGNCAEA